MRPLVLPPRSLRLLLPLVLLAALLPAALTAAGGAPLRSASAAGTSAASTFAASAATGSAEATPQLVAVRTAAHPGFDRVVWEFDGALPERTVVRRSTALHADGSGDRLPIAGRSVLVVTVIGADAHDDAGRPTVGRRVAPGLRNVVELVQSGDFEAVVSYGVGVLADGPYRVSRLTRPSRVVLDVDVPRRTTGVQVFLQDRAAYAAGRQPDTVPVWRRVPAAAPATAALSHLFAGPTAAEQRRGLAVVRSGATGFHGLSIRDGVARVRLTGGCASGGATYTVADLITRTLRQFASVDHVKIYDPQGRTARPDGRSDSRPACLEP